MSSYQIIEIGFHFGLGLVGGGYVAFVLIETTNKVVHACFEYAKRF